MRALILAAGEGKRLRPMVVNRPKCLAELLGRPLLEHQLASLRSAGIERVTLATGYRADILEALGYDTRHNPDYATTNMVATLMCAADHFDGREDVLIAYADIVYEPRVVNALLGCEAPLATTVDRSWLKLWRARAADPMKDAETLKLSAEGNILELGRRPQSAEEIQGQYMGLIKVSAHFAPELVKIYRSLDPGARYEGKDLRNMYMTAFLQEIVDRGHPLRAVMVESGWLEVDCVSDLVLYQKLADEGVLSKFWRPVPAPAGQS